MLMNATFNRFLLKLYFMGNNAKEKTERATFGTGCFWCREAMFRRLKGVLQVRAGFSGGYVKKPVYSQVAEGQTGLAGSCADSLPSHNRQL